MLAAVDVLARVLGGIGTGATVLAALVAALSYRRDRPQLKITYQLEWRGSELAFLRVHVVNDGRQPVAVRSTEVQNFLEARPWWLSAAERARVSGWLYRRGWVLRRGEGGQGIAPKPPLVQPWTLEPGEPADFAFSAGVLVPFAATHAGERIYIVVNDVLGRERSKELQGDLVSWIATGAHIPPTAEAARALREERPRGGDGDESR